MSFFYQPFAALQEGGLRSSPGGIKEMGQGDYMHLFPIRVDLAMQIQGDIGLPKVVADNGSDFQI